MNQSLSKYLQALSHELRVLPLQKREEELREVRQHLESLIARAIESGASEEEAAQSAIAQFGSARKIGRKLRRASQKRESAWRVLAAPMCGYGLQLVLIVGVLGLMLLVDPEAGFGSAKPFGWYNMSNPLLYVTFKLLLESTAFSGGVLAGRIAPRSALWSVPISFTLLVLAFAPVFSPGGVKPLGLLLSLLPHVLGVLIGSRWAHKIQSA